jgi:hypothetical protein
MVFSFWSFFQENNPAVPVVGYQPPGWILLVLIQAYPAVTVVKKLAVEVYLHYEIWIISIYFKVVIGGKAPRQTALLSVKPEAARGIVDDSGNFLRLKSTPRPFLSGELNQKIRYV